MSKILSDDDKSLLIILVFIFGSVGLAVGVGEILHITIIEPMSTASLGRAEFDLLKINSCDSLIVFNSNLEHYNLTPDDMNGIHNAIMQKTEELKCP